MLKTITFERYNRSSKYVWLTALIISSNAESILSTWTLIWNIFPPLTDISWQVLTQLLNNYHSLKLTQSTYIIPCHMLSDFLVLLFLYWDFLIISLGNTFHVFCKLFKEVFTITLLQEKEEIGEEMEMSWRKRMLFSLKEFVFSDQWRAKPHKIWLLFSLRMESSHITVTYSISPNISLIPCYAGNYFSQVWL